MPLHYVITYYNTPLGYVVGHIYSIYYFMLYYIIFACHNILRYTLWFSGFRISPKPCLLGAGIIAKQAASTLQRSLPEVPGRGRWGSKGGGGRGGRGGVRRGRSCAPKSRNAITPLWAWVRGGRGRRRRRSGRAGRGLGGSRLRCGPRDGRGG